MGTIYHTMRSANGNWPIPFEDVQNVVSNGKQIGSIRLQSCVTNSDGNLHVFVTQFAGDLYHTMRSANGNWPIPFEDVQNVVSNGKQISNLDTIRCSTNSAGDLHVLAVGGDHRLYHTIRSANGNWPIPFEDVQNVAGNIGYILTDACATNTAGDLHVLAVGEDEGYGPNYRLYHTIRSANGNWLYFAFEDVKNVVSNGYNIGNLVAVSCSTNSAGDLHVLAIDADQRLYHTIRSANGNWPIPFEDVKNVVSNGNSIGNLGYISCSTNSVGDLHICVSIFVTT
jgi:hypothetical protein